MAKHDEAELEMLSNLFNFIQKKYDEQSIATIEKKFGEAARNLVDIGEIQENSLKSFCEDEGLEFPKKKEKTSASSSSYSGYDPCGRSSSYRSGC